MQLRPYQQETIDIILTKFYSGVNRQVVKWSTGLGKTVLFCNLPDEMKLDKRMMVLVNRDELCTQAVDKLQRWNPTRKIGIEMGDQSCSLYDDIVVASVQTLGRNNSLRIGKFGPKSFGLLVIDECHYSAAPSYDRVFKHFDIWNNADLLTLGLTATPKRTDGKGLNHIYQEIVYDYPLLQGIRDGWLADLRGIKVKTKTSLENVRTKGGDFDVTQLTNTINTDVRNEDVVKSWLEYGDDRQTLVYVPRIDHAKELAGAFKRYGCSFEAVWGDDPDRKLKLKMHRERKLRGLVNVDLLVTGYDDWQVGCIVMARPTQSETWFTQALGRGTRIPEGIANLKEALRLGEPVEKKDCIVIDMVDNTRRHSLVTLPTLFGLNAEGDMKGKPVTKIVEEVEQAQAKKPGIDLTKVEDLTKIKTYAEQVDLFEVKFLPEIVQISDLQWHKTGEASYCLLLTNNDGCVVSQVNGKWWLSGTVRGAEIMDSFDSFQNAIQSADFRVKVMGGKDYTTLCSREAKWHKDPPRDSQLQLAKKLGINVPPGATRGDVSKKINAVLTLRKARRQVA